MHPHTFRLSERNTGMEKYVKVRKIGQGSYGSAYLATRKTVVSNPSTKLDEQHHQQQFVIKEILLDPRDQANAQREARLLAALDHPNIIACKESFLLKPSISNAALLGRYQQHPTVLCIVTEFADGGDLSQDLERRARYRKFFDPDELLGLFVQVCLALKHLHDRKILHRDVKPANIFLTKSGVVKVGDLGVATVLSHTLACAQTSIGTPYYTAPEICLGKRYNAKADVWSLGCVLYEMATFAHAFEGRSQRQLFDNIVRGMSPQIPACESLSSIRRELQALVDDMLRKEPRARPSVNQLIRRPLVLARIQTFLSAHALASELNHTVLHGQNVFRKKSIGEDKCLPVAPTSQQVRRAELAAQASEMNSAVKPSSRQLQAKFKKTSPRAQKGKVRVGSFLSASRKARGMPNGALRRNRPIQKQVQPAQIPSRLAAVNNANAANLRVRAKRPGGGNSAQVKENLKAHHKANEAAAAAVAALPDPPTAPKTKLKNQGQAKPLSKISERVADFNTKREQLKQNLPPPPPSSAVRRVAKSANGPPKPKQSAPAYPKPVVVGIEGKTLSANKHAPPPPAPVRIRRQQTPPKSQHPVIRANQPSLREHRLEFQRKRQAELANEDGKTSASPLDDPIILVQQLPDFKTPPTPCVQMTTERVPPPAPITLTSSLPEFVEKDEENTAHSSHSEDDEDHDLTSLPSMANLEFERMVLQLKGVVESDMTSSDDDSEEGGPAEELFDPSTPPPPYSPPITAPTPPLSLETLNTSVLEDPAFRLALQKRLQRLPKSAGVVLPPSEHVKDTDGEQVLEDPAQQAILTWLHTYIASLL
ncbi:unnamed protein product [Phytophthora lilii]|uniref:non-specific serine/threonine protein kinase n=1 Tax=Phytophthora lilii TaxID=2077276 RepID=A0A9W6YIK9_9STRA|nr:unnamed protein product [Phytophthora lilii]